MNEPQITTSGLLAVDRVYLASQSPRRAALLQQIGVGFEVVPAAIDETPLAGERAADYVLRLAREKARASCNQLVERKDFWPVLAADTAVVVDGEILGKPAGREQGLAMLEKLSGRSHDVLTAIALIDRRQPGCHSIEQRLVSTEVTFRAVSPQEISAYWQSGEPVDKAGGYAIQGLAAVFIAAVKGSYSAVVGLPLLETHELLKQLESL